MTQKRIILTAAFFVTAFCISVSFFNSGKVTILDQARAEGEGCGANPPCPWD